LVKILAVIDLVVKILAAKVFKIGWLKDLFAFGAS
jgi:hypothetical protein